MKESLFSIFLVYIPFQCSWFSCWDQRKDREIRNRGLGHVERAHYGKDFAIAARATYNSPSQDLDRAVAVIEEDLVESYEVFRFE